MNKNAMTSPSKPASKAESSADSRARSFMKQDFPYIRKATVTLGVCAAIAAALISGSSWLLSTTQKAKDQAQTQRIAARDKLLQTELEKDEIRNFQPKYLNLRSRGFVGEEKRMDWIEHIRRIQENRKLLPMKYEISAQQPFQVDPAVEMGNLELRGSRMRLEMDLLHEMDFLNFLDDLRNAGFITVQECAFAPPETNSALALPPTLRAKCTLHWVSMEIKSAENPDGAQASAGGADAPR